MCDICCEESWTQGVEPTPKMYVAGSKGGRIEPSKPVHLGHGLLGFVDCLAGFWFSSIFSYYGPILSFGMVKYILCH